MNSENAEVEQFNTTRQHISIILLIHRSAQWPILLKALNSMVNIQMIAHSQILKLALTMCRQISSTGILGRLCIVIHRSLNGVCMGNHEIWDGRSYNSRRRGTSTA